MPANSRNGSNFDYHTTELRKAPKYPPLTNHEKQLKILLQVQPQKIVNEVTRRTGRSAQQLFKGGKNHVKAKTIIYSFFHLHLMGRKM